MFLQPKKFKYKKIKKGKLSKLEFKSSAYANSATRA